MAPVKIVMVCKTCGSNDVTRDGLCRWSVRDQEWYMSSELDNCDCENCGGETDLVEKVLYATGEYYG